MGKCFETCLVIGSEGEVRQYRVAEATCPMPANTEQLVSLHLLDIVRKFGNRNGTWNYREKKEEKR